ncbi:MAG: hypothetical protein FWG07_04435 [Treponema sp.]|nr:hypothetical protein [Treponema sp.]
MKLRIQYFILVGLFVSFAFFSCKTPDAGATASLTGGAGLVQQELTGPADEASLQAYAEAMAKAKEARSMAEYVNGPAHYPNEWKLAETHFSAAGNRGGDPETREDANVRIAEWNTVKLEYDEIYRKSLDQFASEQQVALANAKGKAVEAGAEDLVPDRFAMANAMADKSRELYENGDIQGSINAGKEAQDRYRILETLALARAKQEEADEYNFFTVDPDNYVLAAEAGNDAVDFYDEGNLAKAQAEATAAYNGFREVIKNGWSEPVEEKTSAAIESRTHAQEIKADVAARSDFAAAENVYNEAYVALRAEKYTEAIELFEESDRLFEIAYNNAMDKRRIAEEALRRAEEKLTESEEFAQYADDIIGGDE